MSMDNKLALSLDTKNARLHPERNSAAVLSSFRELGAGRSVVVDNKGVVIGGNCALEQAQKLGLPLEFVHTRGDRLVVVVRDDLDTDDPRRQALAIADNQTALLAEWDEENLAEILEELRNSEIDATLTGFEDEEISQLLGEELPPPPEERGAAVDKRKESGTIVSVGSYMFPFEKEFYESWVELVRQKVGMDEGIIVKEIKKRLKIC